jgi:DNA-binding NarL/FixJ family response regulator
MQELKWRTMQTQNLPKLSPRQQEVCALIANARANKEIAHELGLSNGSVKEYIHQIMVRTGCRNRVEIAKRWLLQNQAAVQDQMHAS